LIGIIILNLEELINESKREWKRDEQIKQKKALNIKGSIREKLFNTCDISLELFDDVIYVSVKISFYSSKKKRKKNIYLKKEKENI
jgi:hypothetical protein